MEHRNFAPDLYVAPSAVAGSPYWQITSRLVLVTLALGATAFAVLAGIRLVLDASLLN